MRCFRASILAACALLLSGCLRSQEPLNPPVLVTSADTDMSIQLFMQATILLGRYYDFNTLDYEDLRDRSARRGYNNVLPFMPPISTRATPEFKFPPNAEVRTNRFFVAANLTGQKFRDWADGRTDANGNPKPNGASRDGHSLLVGYYVWTGSRAAQLICRDYLVGLAEQNAYLEFLQREFNIGATLANASLLAAGANVTLRAIGLATQWTGNQAIDAFQEYRFLPLVDRDTARALVEAAQNEIANTFLEKLNAPANSPKGAFFPAGRFTGDINSQSPFAEAVQIVSLIEYQCTRTGIRGLVNKAGAAAAAGKNTMKFDLKTNDIFYR